ncbi:gpW protein [Amphritea atlantica]|uniref:GpW protein n=1 Tax=Amphritea atlantica TaxID=355243 RepID=A0A1H9GFP3_9GAMM|nr:gpW family head-tail joining protein [Amphritea atlantica]SEQ48911.1 gpW protein [Amphritea atlantica]
MATQSQLDEARAAKHALLTGRKAVKVQKDGRSVEYTAVNLPDLEKYIQSLETQLGVTQLRRPMGVFL